MATPHRQVDVGGTLSVPAWCCTLLLPAAPAAESPLLLARMLAAADYCCWHTQLLHRTCCTASLPASQCPCTLQVFSKEPIVIDSLRDYTSVSIGGSGFYFHACGLALVAADEQDPSAWAQPGGEAACWGALIAAVLCRSCCAGPAGLAVVVRGLPCRDCCAVLGHAVHAAAIMH